LPEQSAEVYAKTHVYFGHWLGKTIQAFIQQYGLQPDFVAMHGQTIFHQPHKTFTAQIGDGETVAAYLPCPLVSNFRNKDVALGGEGAPLVPLGEQYLFQPYELFLNLGGFSNVAWKGKGFDVSSCNGVLNFLFQRGFPEGETAYDPGGQVARQGKLLPEVLAQLDALPYYQQTPPKSLGWEWVEAEMLPILAAAEAPVEDLLHTCCVHEAKQIALALEREGVRNLPILATGGGCHNYFFMECLDEALEPLGIQVDDDAPEAWIDYKEAIVFAFLGLRTLLGKPTIQPAATGAKQAAVTGSIHLPPHGQGLASFFR
jgi:anhydro-N-acetylmuramic acid kinase